MTTDPSASTREILLVEDNPDDVALTLRAFTLNRIANPVHVSSDGVEALDYLFARGAYTARDARLTPPITLLDLKLPKLDGLAVLRAVRSDPRTRLMPVVVLTSSVEEEDVLNSYSLGVNSYIRKPVDFEQFVEAIKHLGLYWLVLNVAPTSQIGDLR